MQQKSNHIPIMIPEMLKTFEKSTLKVFFDGTVGAGGHARAVLEAHPEVEKYIACDRDPQALQIAQNGLKAWNHKLEFVRGNFADLDTILLKRGIQEVNGFFLT